MPVSLAEVSFLVRRYGARTTDQVPSVTPTARWLAPDLICRIDVHRGKMILDTSSAIRGSSRLKLLVASSAAVVLPAK